MITSYHPLLNERKERLYLRIESTLIVTLFDESQPILCRSKAICYFNDLS